MRINSSRSISVISITIYKMQIIKVREFSLLLKSLIDILKNYFKYTGKNLGKDISNYALALATSAFSFFADSPFFFFLSFSAPFSPVSDPSPFASSAAAIFFATFDLGAFCT